MRAGQGQHDLPGFRTNSRQDQEKVIVRTLTLPQSVPHPDRPDIQVRSSKDLQHGRLSDVEVLSDELTWLSLGVATHYLIPQRICHTSSSRRGSDLISEACFVDLASAGRRDKFDQTCARATTQVP
jgi:hypothetical protein